MNTLEQIFNADDPYLTNYLKKIDPKTDTYNLNQKRYMIAHYLFGNKQLNTLEFNISDPKFQEALLKANSYQEFVSMLSPVNIDVQNFEDTYDNPNISDGLNLTHYRCIEQEDDRIFVNITFKYKSDVIIDHVKEYFSDNMKEFKNEYSNYVSKALRRGKFILTTENIVEGDYDEKLMIHLPIEKCRNALNILDQLLQKSFK